MTGETKTHFEAPLRYHIMDYQAWYQSFRQPTIKGEAFYIDWFLKNSKEKKLSEKLYNEVIIGHPVICTGLTNTIINHGYFGSPEARHRIFFKLGGFWPISNHLNSSIYDSYKSEELEFYMSFLKEIDDEKICVLGEYNQDSGWFDYEDLKNFRESIENK